MRVIVESFGGGEDLAHVKILVGGAPVNQDFADEIGAHGYAPAAPQGVDLVQSLLN